MSGNTFYARLWGSGKHCFWWIPCTWKKAVWFLWCIYNLLSTLTTIISWIWFISHQQCSVSMILHVHAGSISCWWYVCAATTQTYKSSDEIYKILFWNKMVLHQNVPIKFCYFLHYKHFNKKLKTNYNDICNSIIVLNRAYIVQFLPHQNRAVYTLKKADFQLTAELPSWFT